ncbi:MAG: PEGA domain-containing protein [Lachnospiraceae bacterium]|nr:PEGA domain-containing protein [Candidatus Colinaster equi]
MRKYVIIAISYIMLTAFALSGCGNAVNEPKAELERNTGFIVTKAGTYDSADDNAVVVSIDDKEKTITFANYATKRKYTLSYDGASKIFDKYGTSMSMEQLQPGMVVNVTFLKSKKLLNSVTESADAWTIDNVKDFELSDSESRMNMTGGTYSLSDALYVFANDKLAELMDINSVDVLTVRGVDREIFSITIDQGHGYLRLQNEDYFIGGWIEIGSKIIRTIEDDMLLAVPIGSYDVLISNKGVEGTKSVTISANDEQIIDLSDMKTEELITYGKVIAVTTPDTAMVYVDGKEVDKSLPIELEYGIHQMIVKAEGYKTLTQYIKVGQESATIDITLEKSDGGEEEAEGPGVSPVPTSPVPTTPVTTSSDEYKVTISDPVDTEVYLDGMYTGITPLSFKKVPGTHEITLRKDGCITRSYTIELDSTSQDETMSFSNLAEVGD